MITRNATHVPCGIEDYKCLQESNSYYIDKTRREMSGGFVDLYLEPFLARYPDMKVGYLIELKCISQSKFSKTKLKEIIINAEEQFKKYAVGERLNKVKRQVDLKKFVLVYRGWELIYAEVVD